MDGLTQVLHQLDKALLRSRGLKENSPWEFMMTSSRNPLKLEIMQLILSFQNVL